MFLIHYFRHHFKDCGMTVLTNAGLDVPIREGKGTSGILLDNCADIFLIAWLSLFVCFDF